MQQKLNFQRLTQVIGSLSVVALDSHWLALVDLASRFFKSHCMLGSFACFLLSPDPFFFFKINIFEKLFQEYHKIVKQSEHDPRPDRISGLMWIPTVLFQGKHI